MVSAAEYRAAGRGLKVEDEPGLWTGRSVFVATSSGVAPNSPPRATSSYGTTSQGRSGTAMSPIEITSSPSGSSSTSTSSPGRDDRPTTPLPRPRAIPAYSSPISRTAYTPPRAFFPPSPARQMSSPAAASGVHPFFNRTFGRSKSTPVPHTPPPPASQRPRMVAHYSSTSESQASTPSVADSTFGSQPRAWLDQPAERVSQASPSARHAGAPASRSGLSSMSSSQGDEARSDLKGKGKARSALSEVGVEELVAQVESIDLTGKFKPNPMDAAREPGLGSNGDGWPKGPARHQGHGPKPRGPSGKFGGARGPSGEGVPPHTSANSGGATLGRYGRPGPSKGPAPAKGAMPQKSWPAKANGKPDGQHPPKSNKASLPAQQASIPWASTSKAVPAPRAQSTAAAAPTQKSKSTQIPDPPPPGGYFAYTDYSPTPEVVYTTDFAEADALLSRLQGNVLGLDLEWPWAGFYKMPGGGPKKVVGMTWNTKLNKWDWGQGKTALIQICDERLIVLIHLKDDNNMTLPQKVIDIVQDKTVYKCGVQVQGDGLKLVRDFPGLFPRGANSLLELTKVARRVDPINVVPGKTLISLARLTEAYTGKPLLKESKVRNSAWFFDLDEAQIQYAANDAYAGLQVYLRLQQLSKENKFPLNLTACSNNVSPDGNNRSSPSSASSSNPATATTPLLDLPELVLAPGQHKYPPPRACNVLNRFRSGQSMKDIATEADIKPATAESYILSALDVLADDTLSPEEMGRLVRQLRVSWVRKMFKVLLVRLRRGSGQVVSDSEASVEELDSEEEDKSTGDQARSDVRSYVEVEEISVGLSGVSMVEPTAGQPGLKAGKAKDIDHGWTAEEIEAAMLLSDSDNEAR